MIRAEYRHPASIKHDLWGIMSPDYEKITTLLATQNIFNAAAELHGLICGQLSTGSAPLQYQLIAQLMNVDGGFAPVLEQLIERLGKDFTAQMSDGEFSFQLLVPDDDEDISLRVYALGKWCEGFNLGFGAGFGGGDKAMLEETREVISDFTNIAQVEDRLVDDADDEQNEEDYMELVEYARMAVTTVFNQNNASESNDSEIH